MFSVFRGRWCTGRWNGHQVMTPPDHDVTDCNDVTWTSWHLKSRKLGCLSNTLCRLRPKITHKLHYRTFATWWRHQWKYFPRSWPFVRGIHRWQRPVTRSFDVFDLRLNKPLSKQSWGWWFETPSRPLWRYCSESSPLDKGPVMWKAFPRHHDITDFSS